MLKQSLGAEVTATRWIALSMKGADAVAGQHLVGVHPASILKKTAVKVVCLYVLRRDNEGSSRDYPCHLFRHRVIRRHE